MLRYKEELLTNWKNGVYHLLEDVDLMAKKLEDADKQLVECMQQIKSLAAEKELKQEELKELKGAAQLVVDMVVPVEEGVLKVRRLLEHLHEVPQKISNYVFGTIRTFAMHVLGLIKSLFIRRQM